MHKKIKTERLSILKKNNNRNKIMVKIHIEIHDSFFSSLVPVAYIFCFIGFSFACGKIIIVCLYH